jgi:hypothetical protein
VKKNWDKILIIGIMAVAVIAWLVWSKTPHGPPVAVVPPTSSQPTSQPIAVVPSNAPAVPGKPHDWTLNHGERPSEFTEEEKQAFTNLFVTKLKPVAEKWASVYTNRVPFNLADLTPDKVVDRHGWGDSRYDSYMFVMGDITFGIEIFGGDTHVNYLASRQGVRAMNAMPKLAGPADLSMPVTREQVLDLVEADSGKRFPPNEIALTPTGQSGSLMGGATVEVGKDASNPEFTHVTTKETSFSLTFDSDGKLVYYERDP